MAPSDCPNQVWQSHKSGPSHTYRQIPPGTHLAFAFADGRVGAFERGERNLSLMNIEKIAWTFGISLSELFRGV